MTQWVGCSPDEREQRAGQRDTAAIREYCERHSFSLDAVIPFDDAITEADLAGRSLIDVAPDSSAVAAIESLADTLVARIGGAITA